MTRQLEDPENSHKPNDTDEGKRHWRLCAFVFGQLCSESDEEGNDGEEVDDVHDIFAEDHFAGSAEEADNELKGEPANTDGLDDKERVLKRAEGRRDQDGFVGDGGVGDGGVLLWRKGKRQIVTKVGDYFYICFIEVL